MEPCSLPELRGWTWWSEEQSQCGVCRAGCWEGVSERLLNRSLEVPSSCVHLSTSAGHGGNSQRMTESASRSMHMAGNSSCSYQAE